MFAIGLSPVFSFRWNLPPTLSCTPKQLDSSKAHRTHAVSQKDGILTLYDALFQGTYSGAAAGDSFCRLQFGAAKRHPDLKHELLPLHSPLLGESLLVSFPPLSNMLKSSGSSSQSEARKGRSCDRFSLRTTQIRPPRQTNDLSPCGATTLVSRCVFGELSLHFGRHSERRTPMLGLPKLPPRAASCQPATEWTDRHFVYTAAPASEDNRHSNWNAPRHIPEAQYAFKILMIH